MAAPHLLQLSTGPRPLQWPMVSPRGQQCQGARLLDSQGQQLYKRSPYLLAGR